MSINKYFRISVGLYTYLHSLGNISVQFSDSSDESKITMRCHQIKKNSCQPPKKQTWVEAPTAYKKEKKPPPILNEADESDASELLGVAGMIIVILTVAVPLKSHPSEYVLYHPWIWYVWGLSYTINHLYPYPFIIYIYSYYYIHWQIFVSWYIHIHLSWYSYYDHHL